MLLNLLFVKTIVRNAMRLFWRKVFPEKPELDLTEHQMGTESLCEFEKEAEQDVIHLDDDDTAITAGKSQFDDEAAKQILIYRQVWNPKWSSAGFSEVFDCLESEDSKRNFVELLSTIQDSVPIGKAERMTPPPVGEEIKCNGKINPESIERHRRALMLQRENPTLSYVEALIRSSSASAV